MTTPNRHAALMRQYTEEHILDPFAYRNWEGRYESVPVRVWVVLDGHPQWQSDCEYRRKGKTISIGGIEVPEPMRVAPELGERYYRVDVAVPPFYDSFSWRYDRHDRLALNRGLCHKTESAAIAHAKAIIIASGGKVGE